MNILEKNLAIASDQEVIIAQCTPSGIGALALLRMTGIHTIEVATRISLLADGQLLSQLPTHTIHYGWVIDTRQNSDSTQLKNIKLDNVLFFLMRGPKTFTGQDTVEITCHNNPFIIESIIQQAILHGARLAQNGEFSFRAVLNNKIDVLQAEAINELIHANTQMGLKQALAQVNGSFSSWIQKIEKQLLKILAFCQASFEFIDEEITFDDQIKEMVAHALSELNAAKITFDQQKHIRNGIRIALVGSVNVGKSSIFNFFLQQNRAIVTDIAGTTRDVIEAGLYRTGNYWTLIDTAGLRETDNTIEQVGIIKSFEQAQLADIILLVFDGSRAFSQNENIIYADLYEQYKDKIIMVCNKVDLPQASETIDWQSYPVSTKNGTGFSDLEKALEERVEKLFATINSPFLLNKRQFNIITALEKDVKHIETLLYSTLQYEIIAYHLVDALAHCSELTGKSISEQGLDLVFREFCVGK